MGMTKLSKQALDGNVQTLLLSILESGPSYGYAITKELNSRSKGILRLGEGTIYPVLHRLEAKKLLSSTWRPSGTGRQRKYYHLTAKGRRALAANLQQWHLLSTAMQKVLGPAINLLPKPQLKGAIP